MVNCSFCEKAKNQQEQQRQFGDRAETSENKDF
jgi:hypothetical protein